MKTTDYDNPVQYLTHDKSWFCTTSEAPAWIRLCCDYGKNTLLPASGCPHGKVLSIKVKAKGACVKFKNDERLISSAIQRRQQNKDNKKRPGRLPDLIWLYVFKCASTSVVT